MKNLQKNLGGFVLLGALFASTSAHAQWFFGFRDGTGYYNPVGKSSPYEFRRGFMAGPSFEYQWENVSLMTDVLYSERVEGYESNPAGPAETIVNNVFHYVMIPVQGKYSWPILNNSWFRDFYVSLGGYYALGVGKVKRDERSSDAGGTKTYTYDQVSFKTSGQKSNDWGLVAGLGTHLPLRGGADIVLEARATQGLMNLSETANRLRSTSYEFLVGLMF